jgi:hypothetical protein
MKIKKIALFSNGSAYAICGDMEISYFINADWRNKEELKEIKNCGVQIIKGKYGTYAEPLNDSWKQNREINSPELDEFKTNDPIFKFGKNKGITIKEVYTGKKIIDINLLSKYMQDRITDIDPSITNLSLLPLCFNIKINAPYIVLSKINTHNLKCSFDFESELNSLFMGANFYIGTDSVEWFMKEQKCSNGDLNFVSGQPKYIAWCIENINNFFLDPLFIEELESLEIFIFNGIISEKITDELFYFKPKFVNSKYQFSEKIKMINFEKYENKLILKDDFDYMSQDKYQGKYGYDDNTIDSAFEGDPENYWNID